MTVFIWLGRVNIIKINILPKILQLPVPLPKGFFAQLSSMLAGFVWISLKARIAMRLLKCPKHTGGLGVLEIQRYYRAAMALQVILNWCFHTHSKVWVSMEKYMATRNLSYAMWPSLGTEGVVGWHISSDDSCA